ncbi:hypothetical protein HMPREF9104_03064 [Lentilactobacillus kisonensis F0435]|uniref:Uncharacterized protein n=1 Tax=Lentilactobacillus kisonensis F0435 TaxID=797516 RepID=H1LKB8_9LACO|nr:hypothetical protein HMPREF9104_03064 [Lentilactobacillus kisonensis F0435]
MCGYSYQFNGKYYSTNLYKLRTPKKDQHSQFADLLISQFMILSSRIPRC